jgi:hypothetical protein
MDGILIMSNEGRSDNQSNWEMRYNNFKVSGDVGALETIGTITTQQM